MGELIGLRAIEIRRLITISTLSASDPDDLPDLKFKAVVTLARLTMPAVCEEVVSGQLQASPGITSDDAEEPEDQRVLRVHPVP